MTTDEVFEVDEASVRRAQTRVVLAALKRTLGEDNVDLCGDDGFRIGVSMPPSGESWFEVVVVERAAVGGGKTDAHE